MPQLPNPKKKKADLLLTQGLDRLRLEEDLEAIELLTQALDIYREINERSEEAQSLVWLGLSHATQNIEKGICYYQQGLSLAREIKNRQVEVLALGSLANAYYLKGETVRAIAYCEEALPIAREIHDRHESGLLSFMIFACKEVGDQAKAEYYEQQDRLF